MNQLAKTNNNNFTLETSIMEQILDASGYHFHVLTIKGQKYWIAKEIVHAFGFLKNHQILCFPSRSLKKDLIFAFLEKIKCANLEVRTLVFPVPAPDKTKSGPSVVVTAFN